MLGWRGRWREVCETKKEEDEVKEEKAKQLCQESGFAREPLAPFFSRWIHLIQRLIFAMPF